MRFIITRHGETEENKMGIRMGHIPGKLSAEGIDQARKVALRLKDEHIDVIYASTLARAADTAQAIAEYHPDTPCIFTKSMMERDFGEFSGTKRSDSTQEENLSSDFFHPQRGEDMDQLYERMHQFFWEIFPLYSQDTTILCVGHNGTNKALIAAATGKTIEDMEDMPHLDNTSICILNIDQEGHGTIETYNDAEHLKT